MSPTCSNRFLAGRKARSATLRTMRRLPLVQLTLPCATVDRATGRKGYDKDVAGGADHDSRDTNGIFFLRGEEKGGEQGPGGAAHAACRGAGGRARLGGRLRRRRQAGRQ